MTQSELCTALAAALQTLPIAEVMVWNETDFIHKAELKLLSSDSLAFILPKGSSWANEPLHGPGGTLTAVRTTRTFDLEITLTANTIAAAPADASRTAAELSEDLVALIHAQPIPGYLATCQSLKPLPIDPDTMPGRAAWILELQATETDS